MMEDEFCLHLKKTESFLCLLFANICLRDWLWPFDSGFYEGHHPLVSMGLGSRSPNGYQNPCGCGWSSPVCKMLKHSLLSVPQFPHLWTQSVIGEGPAGTEGWLCVNVGKSVQAYFLSLCFTDSAFTCVSVLQIEDLWQPCIVRWWLAYFSNKVLLKVCTLLF